MSVTVKLPTQLRSAAGGQSTVEVEGGTVGEALEALFAVHGELRDRLSDPEAGGLRRFVNVYVDGDDIRFGDGLDTAVRPGGEVTILPAVAGGR
jgi:sulfur-carrier protein